MTRKDLIEAMKFTVENHQSVWFLLGVINSKLKIGFNDPEYDRLFSEISKNTTERYLD